MSLTLGSLFDGSGGFPLGGVMAGIKPLWASEIEPFPIRVTTKRFPNMKHYGDVSAINGFSISPVDIITFGSPCFPEGTLVLTSEGYLPIEEVTPGMQVLTHQGRWRKVTAAGAKLGETVVLKGNHYGLECTPNHPIYSSGERKDYSLLTDVKKWIPAGEMKGRLWGVPNHADALPIAPPVYSESRKEKKFPPLSNELFYFVGRWIEDGWVRNDSYDKEGELRKTVEGVSNRYSVSNTKTYVKLGFYSKVFTEWLVDNFGRYATEKTLPAWVFGMCESWRAALLKGLLDSDGYKVKDNGCTYRISTISKKLAESIRLLGEIQGYSTKVFFTKTPDTAVIEGRTVNQKDYYTVELAKGKKRRHLSDNLHGWYRVRSVTPTHEVKPVYNLTVEEDNSYIADGIVVHNCQDLSIAGKREGIEGARSGLFYQAVRIIKEMRGATNGKYPRYIVWENVPGAFSSNKGEDFGCVLDEICRIRSAEDIHIPRPKKWNHAGCIMRKNYSVAWRVLDALGFGVPQRRKRIYLVGDLDGWSAEKVLFESEGMSGYSEQGFKAWKESSRCPQIRLGEPDSSMCIDDEFSLFDNHRADCRYDGPLSHAPSVCAYYRTGGVNTPLVAEPYTMRIRCGKPGGGKGALIQKGISGTLGCNNDQTLFQPKAFGICADQSHSMLSENPESGFYEADSSRTIDTSGANPSCNQGGIAVVDMGGGKSSCNVTKDFSPTLTCTHGGEPAVCMDNTHHCEMMAKQDESEVIAIQGSMIGREDKNGPLGSGVNEDISFTLNATDRHAVAYRETAMDDDKSIDDSSPVYSASKSDYQARVVKNHSSALVSTDYKDPPIVSYGSSPYVVRRLTPIECCRLQGFPDWWCCGLGTEEPTDEDMDFWRDVFETHRKLVTHSKKPKTEKQIRKWLKQPYSDSAAYKMWGNGVALPCVWFVLSGIVWADSQY